MGKTLAEEMLEEWWKENVTDNSDGFTGNKSLEKNTRKEEGLEKVDKLTKLFPTQIQKQED
jgi:hypothetical protein